jgi:hypothetical protein
MPMVMNLVILTTGGGNLSLWKWTAMPSSEPACRETRLTGLTKEASP